MRLRLRDRGLAELRPELVAQALVRAATSIDVTGVESDPRGRRRGRLLVLPKDGGTEDLVAAIASRPDAPIGLVGLPRPEVKAMFRSFVGPDADLVTDRHHRLDHAPTLEGRARYRSFLRPVMARLRDELDVVAVVGANVTYFAERELGGACEDIGLPFLVIHKESIRSPRQREWFTRAYRERTGAFLGRAVAVYNRSERDSQREAGIVTDAAVVGAPRVDAAHAIRRHRADSRRRGDAVVLFAIDPGAGTWTPFDDELETGAPRWEVLAHETEQAVIDFARANPGSEIIIKSKVGHDRALLARLPSTLPPNLRVVTVGTATSLLEIASAVVAFNSTVVPEALAAGVPVVSPEFAEAAGPGARDWCYPVDQAVGVARSPEEIVTLLERAVEGGALPDAAAPLPPGALEVLDDLVGDADGRASVRARRFIEDHVPAVG